MASEKNLITISSTNCRGLGEYTKRKDVFNYLRNKGHNIYCLQDTHFTKSMEPYIKAEWGGEIIFNSYNSNSRGVCILFNNNIEYKILRSNADQEGNLLILDLEIEGQHISLVNIYGPNDDMPIFYQTMYEAIEEFANEKVIICGDFNLVQSQDLDTHNYVNINNPRAKQKVIDIKDELNMVDPFRELYNNLKRYTWRKSNPIKQARLDFFLISETIMQNVNDLEILPSYRSDHSTVVLSLELNEFVKGRGLWKFNTSLLKDKDYVNAVKQCIVDIKERYMLPVYSKEFIEDNLNNDLLEITISHQLFLEMLLMEIRGKTISYSAYKQKKRKEDEEKLIQEIASLENSTQLNFDLIETKKEELENIRKEKIKGIIIRSRVRWAEEGEKPTKYFCNLESRNFTNKTIYKIENDNGDTITKQKEILHEVKHFYENLYKCHDLNETQDDEITSILENIQHHPKLSLESKNSLEGELTDKEILAALKKMKNNKSLGTDGFTSEFFKFFYNDIKVFLKRALNESYKEGKLSITQRQGLITCIPKGDKPKQFLKNWRPITLLNVVYKIASACIAERIKSVLTGIISEDQTGFLSGRYIGENTRLIYDILHITDEQDIPGLLLIVDFEKAFDSISWKFINRTLNFLNFGDSIKRWISVFYNDIQSCVIQNGFLSEPFTVQRGCRQGDPLSPYIFLLCAEILSRQFKANPDIKGIEIAGIEYLLSQFADDTTILLDGSENSLNEALKILNKFALASGLKLNANKTRAVWIGSRKFSGETFNHRLKLDWNQNDFTILGIKFSCNLDTIVDINYNTKFEEIEKEMKSWAKRILTPLGRLTVLKTLLVSKLNHLIIALPNPSRETISKLNKLFFEFIWKSSTDKIKRDVIIQDFDQGGLRMINIEKYILALKLGWIRRLVKCDSKYKTLFESLHGNVEILLKKGDTYIEEIKNICSNKFWSDVLDAWYNFIKLLSPKTKEDIMGINLWNNSKIKINNVPVFYRRWYNKNIIFIKDLVNQDGRFLSHDVFQNKYDIQCNFLEFLGIKTVVENYVRQLGIDLITDPFPLTNSVLPKI